MNYDIKPYWDTSLAIVFTLGTISPNSVLNGLVYYGVKSTAGAPANLAGRYVPYATIEAADGLYVNKGTTASPSFQLAQVGPDTNAAVVLATKSPFDFNKTATVTYDTLAGGTFSPGDTITFTSGTTALVVTDDGVGSLTCNIQTGVATPDFGEAFNNGGGVSAAVVTYVSGDQAFALTPGSVFNLFDILFSDASVSLTTVDDIEFWTGPDRTGTQLAAIDTATLALLTSSSKFVSTKTEIANTGSTATLFFTNDQAGATIYASIGIPQGAAATGKVKVVGYVQS